MLATVLIAGLGQIGMGYDFDLDPDRFVLTHARAFTQHPAYRLVAGVDPDPRRRALFGERFGAGVAADLEAGLVEFQPDVVVIAGPTAQHGAMLRQALEMANPQAILCEKPLSYDLSEARAMVRACADRGVRLYVNYMRRSDPGAVEVGRRLASGEIAGTIKGLAWYSKGLLHNGSHFVNLVESWLGPVQSVQLLDAGREWEGTDPEPDVRTTFERGAMVFLAAREEEFSHYTVELLGSNGRLRYDDGGRLIHWHAATPHPVLRGYRMLSAAPEELANGMARSQWHVTDQLAEAIAGRPAHLCAGDEGLRTLETLNTIIRLR